VLIVDDGETNRKLVRLLLEKHGIATAVAIDGRQGVDAVIAGSFDLVLMDMQLPVLDGYAATRELRSRNIDVPIIALTANAMRFDRQQCLEAGCNGYLTKPLQSWQLLKAMRDALVRQETGGVPTHLGEFHETLEQDASREMA
jgi:CheY-like chemotaxis protein